MAKFTGVRFYVREKNKWTYLLNLRAGFDASFVLDKTTDSANIVLGLANEPTWLKINSWVALFIKADEDYPTFNDDGTPKNHEQFIVGGYQYYKTLTGYELTVKLIEPIERFRGVLGETLSYTNQTKKVQNGIPYTRDPYNYYTALKRWLQVTPANTDDFGADGEERMASGHAWWNRLKILDKEFLSDIPFADDTFNEMSLYDVLFNVYDSGTGRTPVAYFDIQPTLSEELNETSDPKHPKVALPRNVERDEYLLKFVRQDGLDKPMLEWKDLTANKGRGEVCSGVMKREDGANYATGLVSNVTNLSPNTSVTFPAEVLYAVPEALADVRSVINDNYFKVATDNWGLVLPYNIKNVISLKKIMLSGYERLNYDELKGGHITKADVVDIEVLEKKEYDAYAHDLSSDPSISWYREGENIVYLRDYSSEDPNNRTIISDAILYQVIYEPLIDARIMVGDDEYVQQVNQTSSQVDSEKFGKFMTDYLAGMSKADYTIQRTTEHPERYLEYLGRIVNRDGKTYMITNVALRNRNLQYDVFFQLNENHVRKNMAYQAPQTIRQNTAIQYSNIQDRKIVITDELNISLKRKSNITKPRYLKYRTPVISALLDDNVDSYPYGGIVPRQFYPQVTAILNESKEKDQNNNPIQVRLLCPIVRAVVGNTINFTVCMRDNAIAGKVKHADSFSTGLENAVQDVSYFQRFISQVPLLYTGPFGDIEKTSLTVGRVLKQTEISKTDRLDDYLDVKNFYNAMLSSPLYFDGAISNELVDINGLNIKKDVLEMYNVTYSLKVNCHDGIELCSSFLSKSRLMNAKEKSLYATVKVYFFDKHISSNETLSSLKEKSFNMQYVSKENISRELSKRTMEYLEKEGEVTFSWNEYPPKMPASLMFTYTDLDDVEEKIMIVNLDDEKLKEVARQSITIYF